MEPMNHQRGYDRPIEIADNIYWIGFYERCSNLHCNPYLIIEEDQAVLIDAGSRPDFALVMMKILQTGIAPEQIAALIYHHYDPDLCGSLSNMVDIGKNPKLIVLSEPDNVLRVFTARSRRKNLVEQTLSRGACVSMEF